MYARVLLDRDAEDCLRVGAHLDNNVGIAVPARLGGTQQHRQDLCAKTDKRDISETCTRKGLYRQNFGPSVPSKARCANPHPLPQQRK